MVWPSCLWSVWWKGKRFPWGIPPRALKSYTKKCGILPDQEYVICLWSGFEWGTWGVPTKSFSVILYPEVVLNGHQKALHDSLKKALGTEFHFEVGKGVLQSKSFTIAYKPMNTNEVVLIVWCKVYQPRASQLSMKWLWWLGKHCRPTLIFVVL